MPLSSTHMGAAAKRKSVACSAALPSATKTQFATGARRARGRVFIGEHGGRFDVGEDGAINECSRPVWLLMGGWAGLGAAAAVCGPISNDGYDTAAFWELGAEASFSVGVLATSMAALGACSGSTKPIPATTTINSTQPARSSMEGQAVACVSLGCCAIPRERNRACGTAMPKGVG